MPCVEPGARLSRCAASRALSMLTHPDAVGRARRQLAVSKTLGHRNIAQSDDGKRLAIEPQGFAISQHQVIAPVCRQLAGVENSQPPIDHRNAVNKWG
jgi:hypothetical protein